MNRRHAPLGLLAAAFLLLAACGTSTPERNTVLGDLADTHIIPAYDQLLIEATNLDAATDALCAAPSPDSLDAAQTSLAATRAQWSYTEPMWVGPVMERRAWATIDWPIDQQGIEELIGDTAVTLDQDRLSRRIGADQRGLGAVEYILSDPNALTALDGRRCEYLTGIAQVIADEAAFLPDDWTTSFEGSDPYRQTFTTPDENGLDALVNDSLFLLEAMADAELGIALGAMEEPSDLEAILEGPSGLAADDLVAHVAGLRTVYLGDGDSAGLSPLLGDDLTQRLTDQFDTAESAIAQLEGPLRTDIEQRPEVVAAARDALKVIQTTVATEVVAKLGVTIGFSDADGDSG